MMVMIFLLLVLREECGAADLFIDTKSIIVGGQVTMKCSRRSAGDIYWMRIAFGNSLKYNQEKLKESLFSHIKVRQEAGTLELRIIDAKLNDSALYLCVRKYQENITYLNATYLKVEEMAVTRPPPSLPVYPKDSMTQCSVLRYSLNKSCPEDDIMYCFRAEFNKSHSSFNRTQNEEEFKNIFEEFTAQECFQGRSKNLISSGVWMHYCGVSVPEEKVYDDKSEHNIEGKITCDSNHFNPSTNLLSAALVICLVIITLLIYYIKKLEKRLNGGSTATVSVRAQAPLGENQEVQQMDEDSLIYSAPVFPRRVSEKVTRGLTPGETEAIYTEVKCLER